MEEDLTQWTTEQDNALKAVDSWFRNESSEKQVFRLFGPAGTGKSTLAKHFAQNITGSVKFAAFTGKAAHVMEKKGCVGASTIHKLIYNPREKSNDKLLELKEKLEKEKDIKTQKELAKAIEIEERNAGRVHFVLNSASDLKHTDLLIVDEVSMLDSTIGQDLESFGVPILVLGDPEQLPPIYGAGYFTQAEPDILLQEIHRQALDNPIIQMAQLVREGKPLPLGDYGSSRVVNSPLDAKEIAEHDIILTGLRKTKKACDDKCRQLRGFTQQLPVISDRIMCVKNNHQMGLLNGQTWIMARNAYSMGDGTISLFIKHEETGEELVVSSQEKLFRGISLESYEREPNIEEFEYAYAITVHKAQGSQYNSVFLYDQKDRFPAWSARDKQRWLYTGITRAAERVTVMRN